MAKRKRRTGSAAEERIAWHPAFTEAAKAELIEYLDKLEFDVEHQLNTEPLKIDLLIIKKTAEVEIEKNIGRIFRQRNIVEYKSPGDTLTADDYHKVMAYAHLYMSLEKKRYSDMTLTFVSYRRPRELIKYLRQTGSAAEERYPGILYITGAAAEVLPTQIIVSRELDEDENLWLRGLTSDVEPGIGGRVITELDRIGDATALHAYADVFLRANKTKLEEVFRMARTARSMTLEEALERAGVRTEVWEARGEYRGKIEMAIALVNDGDSIERAAKLADIPVEELETYLQ